MKFTIVASLLIVLCGCSALPIQRTQSQAVKAAENISSGQSLMIESFIRSQPQPTNTATFQSHTTLKQEGIQQAGSSEDLNFQWKQSIPWGLSMILFAIGGFLLIRLFKTAKHSSATFSALTYSADQIGAKTLASLRQAMAGMNDEKSKTILQAISADLEKDRGKMAREFGNRMKNV